jgi:ABC-2 type transport system ATP-binding protein
MIDAEGLTKKFDGMTAVDALTFRVQDGEIFGLLGPNGAGKTTTVRMLCCLISKTSGEARIGDYVVGSDVDSPKIRKMIGLVPDNVGLYENMTAYDNLDFYGQLYDLAEADRRANIRRFLEMLGLWDKRDVAAGTFSKGMKQKLAIARALVHEPEVLFLDEPTVNLDPESAKTVRDFLLELKKQKKTIFLNTHNLDEAQRVCDRIAILNTRLMALGSPAELERSVGSRKTVVQLAQVTDAVLGALRKLSVVNLAVDGNRLIIDVADPDTENPAILRAIIEAGGVVQSASVSSSTLEDAYLKLVREKP